MACGNSVVNVLEHRLHGTDKGIALGKEGLAAGCHLLFEDVEKHQVGPLFLLEEGVALLKRTVVSRQLLYVFVVVLGYNHIHEPAAFLAAALNERHVGRRNHHERHKTDVLRQPLIFLLVALEMFFSATLHAAVDCFGGAHWGQRLPCRVVAILPFNDKEVLVVGYHRRIGHTRSTPAERQIVHDIEKVGLPHPVVADETVELWRQLELSSLNVLVI